MILNLFKDDAEAMEKLGRFKEKRELEKDPLVRWCLRPDCEGYIRATSFNVRKVNCPKCNMAICFKCKEEYHGRWTSCASNMEKKFKEWSKGDLKISFCPKC
jgi:hypothetical protein